MIEKGRGFLVNNDGSNITFRNLADSADIPLAPGMLNTANLLAGITPTATGWNTQPATNAEITAELGPNALTTSGVQTNATASTLKYDLGSSKRVVVIVYRTTMGTTADMTLEGSDDDATYSIIGAEEAGTSPRSLFGLGKCRYIRITFGATAAGNTHAQLKIKAYQV